MKYLLSRGSLAVLSRAAHEGLLCAFDFDGTLTKIVSRPDQARLRVRTRKLLAELAGLYPCMVISGRSLADLREQLAGSGIRRIVGNHGAETAAIAGKGRGDIRQWKSALESRMGAMPGVWIEDKGLSLAIHYRQSRRQVSVRREILAAARELQNADLFGGKCVINIVPDDARQKGDALAAERKRLGCKWVLFVGDDDNDETAFSLDGNLISLRIGQKRNSAARYYLRDQAEVDSLLRYLVGLAREAQVRKPKWN